MQYQTSHRYCFLGPKKLQGKNFYVLGRLETQAGGGENAQFLSLTFSPVAIWRRGLYVKLEANHSWQAFLAAKIVKMEG